MRMKNIILALLIGCAFFACVGDVGNTLHVDHANRLLTADTVKIWCRSTRMADGVEQDISAFEESNAMIFYNLAEPSEDSLLIAQSNDCTSNELVGVDSELNYDLLEDIDGNFLDQILLIRGDTVYDSIQVLDLTSRYLRIRYDEGGAEVEESYLIELGQ